jgi:hypothetical protein
MLYEAREIGDEPLGQVAIVEVLGDGADERHRAGRTVMEIRGGGLQIMAGVPLDPPGDEHSLQPFESPREICEPTR